MSERIETSTDKADLDNPYPCPACAVGHCMPLTQGFRCSACGFSPKKGEESPKPDSPRIAYEPPLSPWISVEDQLPDDDINVLIYVPSANEPVWPGYVSMHHHEPLWFWDSGAPASHQVTHWMPIPEPPDAE